MPRDLTATLAVNNLAWLQGVANLEPIASGFSVTAKAAEDRVTAMEGSAPQPEALLSNPSTARTVGPQVVADTGWQDLGDIFGTFAAESAVDGATGTLNHGGTLYLYCDKGDGNPNVGLRVDNIGNNRYKNVYYRSGGQWVIFQGAAATMDYGKALLKEDKFTVSYNDEEGIIQFFVKGVQAHRIVDADVQKAFPGGPGRFGRYVEVSGTDDLKTTLSSNGGAPLRILAVEPHFAGRGTDIHIGYTDSSNGPPTGHDARFPNGVIVPCALTENLRPGRAKITIPDASVPAEYAGKRVVVTVVQRDVSAVQAATDYYATDRVTWGMNISGYPRMFNNLAVNGWRGDGYGKSQYNSANAPWIDIISGEILSFEPGVSSYLMQLDPVAADCLVRVEWEGGQGLELNDPGRATSNPVRSTNKLEFNLKANGTSTYISIPASKWDAANPIRKIWCSEIVASGGAYVDRTTWYAGFIESARQWGYGRCMDFLLPNNYHTGFDDGVLTWANRRTSRLGMRPRHGRILLPTSHASARLSLSIRPYASAEIVSQYLPNNHWYGSKGNNWTVTVVAPASSGSGSITVSGKDITVTPPPANTVQSVIDLFKNTSLMIEMFDISYSGTASSDTMTTLAKTNLRDGINADPAQVSFEDISEFFAKTQLNPFINLNVNCTPDYAVKAMKIILDGTSKVPRAELGNEAFNLSFTGPLWFGAWSIYRGVVETNILDRSIGESCYRAIPVFTALKQAYGDRIITGLGSMAVAPSVTSKIINYPGNSPSIMQKVYIAPYFYPTQDQGDDAKYFAGAYASINSQMVLFESTVKLAAAKGYEVETYEVGQHSTEDNADKALGQERQERRQRSPLMKLAYGYYLGESQRLHGLGRGVPFMHYNWIARISTSQSGAWGVIEYLGQPREEAPKLDAYLDAYDGIFPPYTRYGTNVRILGTRGVGQTVSLDLPATFNTRSIDVQWTADGVAISGAKGWKYKQDSSIVGKKLGVLVTLNGDKGYTTSLTYADSQAVS